MIQSLLTCLPSAGIVHLQYSIGPRNQGRGVRDVRRGGLAIVVSACLALAGCSLFGKKKPDAEQPPPPFPPQTAAAPTAPGNAKGAAFSTTSNPKVAAPGAAGMLAGRVICNYDRQPPPTIIQKSGR